MLSSHVPNKMFLTFFYLNNILKIKKQKSRIFNFYIHFIKDVSYSHSGNDFFILCCSFAPPAPHLQQLFFRAIQSCVCHSDPLHASLQVQPVHRDPGLPRARHVVPQVPPQLSLELRELHQQEPQARLGARRSAAKKTQLESQQRTGRLDTLLWVFIIFI